MDAVGLMAPSKHRWSDNPDWPHVRASVETAIRCYQAHDPGFNQEVPVDDLIEMVGEALIDLAECVGITTHVYG